MRVRPIDDEIRVYKCTGARYEKMSGVNAGTGKAWSRDYLILELDGYERSGSFRIPTSTKNGTLWEAFISCLETGVGRKINGNLTDELVGKSLSLRKYEIEYNKDFSQKHDLVVAVENPTDVKPFVPAFGIRTTLYPKAKPPEEPDFSKKDILVFVSQTPKTAVEIAANFPKISESVIFDAIFELYESGDLYQPTPNAFKAVSPVQETPPEAIRSPTINERQPGVGEYPPEAKAIIDNLNTDSGSVKARLLTLLRYSPTKSLKATDFLSVYPKEAAGKIRFLLNVMASGPAFEVLMTKGSDEITLPK